MGPGLRIVGRYGEDDLLLSGWLEGEELIAGRAAVVEAPVGPGRVVLLGFPVQHRGQSHATFRLLFTRCSRRRNRPRRASSVLTGASSAPF